MEQRLQALGGGRCLRSSHREFERACRTRPLRRHGLFHRDPGAPLRHRPKKGQDQEAHGRSRGGFSTEIHTRCDGQGRPLGFVLTPGQAQDTKGFMSLLHMIGDRIAALLADRATTAMRSVRIWPSATSRQSSRPKPTAGSPRASTAKPTSSAAGSGACSTSSRTGAGSPPATTRPRRPSWSSS